MLYKIIIVVLLSINLSGCVNQINNIDNVRIDQQQIAKISKLQIWQIKGKLSYRDRKHRQSAMCYIKWIKNYNQSYITINSPMNIKTVNLAITNNKINITDSNNIIPKDLEDIINNISINIENLNYWILGAPNPKYAYRLIKNGFVQQQSYVQYLYYNLYNDLALPRTIIINHNYLNIKIIINNFISN